MVADIEEVEMMDASESTLKDSTRKSNISQEGKLSKTQADESISLEEIRNW